MTDDRFRLAFWANPADVEALSVWADALSERGDPRGELIQLSVLGAPTPAQTARCAALKKKLGGKLVGPARPYLRTWTFGSQGLVVAVGCEAKKLTEGFDHIASLHPRLTANVTAARGRATLAGLRTLELERLGYLKLEWSALTDAAVTTIAPAFRGLKNLSLDSNQISGAGLRAIAPFLEGLEFLSLGLGLSQPLEVAHEWVKALCELTALHSLRALSLPACEGELRAEELDSLRRLPRLKTITFGHGAPMALDQVEALKR